MSIKPEEFAKSGFNFALFFANTAFDGIERLAVLNLAATRSAFEAYVSNLNALLGVKDVQSLVELHKGIALGSGLGGSAASAVAAVVAGNALLQAPLPRMALYPHALAGEAVATDSVQGDNVGPMLTGGIVTSSTPCVAPSVVEIVAGKGSLNFAAPAGSNGPCPRPAGLPPSP